MLRKVLTVLLLCFLTVGASACANTFDGAGRDIEKAGEKIQETF